MLVLTRRSGQEVMVKTPDGREIKVIVKELGNGAVRLGFECDEDIKISRLDKPEFRLPQKNEEC